MLFKSKAEFRRVFDDYYNPLCNFVSHFLGNNNRSEDIVQDVFLNLWKNRDNITLNDNIKSYLFQATKNKMLEYLRKEKSYRERVEKLQNQPDLSAGEDELANKLMQLESINQSLRHLPSKCREVFVLHKFKGLSYTEIADKKKISVKTVENHMLKAIKLLRSHLVQNNKNPNEDR